MGYLKDRLIELIVADYYKGSQADCVKFFQTNIVHEQVQADVFQTFQSFGYEMAKGVFVNEVFK